MVHSCGECLIHSSGECLILGRWDNEIYRRPTLIPAHHMCPFVVAHVQGWLADIVVDDLRAVPLSALLESKSMRLVHI